MIVPPTFLTSHLPVAVGLVAGTFAKYGLDLENGNAIVARKVLGHCMMLVLLGLLADAACDVVAGCPPTARAIAGAGAALLSSNLVLRFRKKAEEEADRRLGAQVKP